MTSSFLCEANKLKNVQIYLEKNISSVFNRIRNYEDECLFEYSLDLEKDRKKDRELVTNELQRIWRSLQSKKTLLENDVDILDLHSFKKDMVDLQDRLHTLRLKQQSTVESLKSQEKNFVESLQIYNQKLEDWEKPVKASTISNYNTRNLITSNDDNKEVKAFMDFLNKTSGHENGWSSEDHQLFLKLRHKYKNVDDLAVNLNKLLPDITTAAVKDHEEWFCKYSLLKSRKDEAVKNWRKQKKESREIKENQTEEEPKTISQSKKIFRTKDDNVREQIAAWKAEKEAQRERHKTYERLKEERAKLLEEERKRFHCQVKQEVVKWRGEKTLQEQLEKVQKEIEEHQIKKIRAHTANKMIKRFQSQDDLFIAKVKSKKLKEVNKPTQRSKSSYMANRDPDRILKPTKQWILRTKKEDAVQVSQFVSNIRQVPKLKVPEWRKNS